MNQTDSNTKKSTKLGKGILIRFLMLPFVLALLLFLPAGTIYYWQAWVFSAVILIFSLIIIIYFYRKDPEMLARRMKMKETLKDQKRIIIWADFLYLFVFVIPGIDFRFHWSNVPAALVLIADVFIIAGYVLFAFVVRENSYASRVIEISEGQKVISTGPYAIIRHPMYSAVTIMLLAIPLALGSYWALIPAGLIPVILVLRIKSEEKFLMENLPGYREYCQKTKYRLIPYVW